MIEMFLGFAVLGAAACAGALAGGRRVPPPVVGAVLSAPLVVGLLDFQASLAVAFSDAVAAPLQHAATQQALGLAEATYRWATVGAATTGAAVFVILGGVFAATRAGRKAWATMGLGGGLALLALGPFLRAMGTLGPTGSPAMPAVALGVLGLGVMTGTAMIGRDNRANAPEAAGAAGLAFPFAVAGLGLAMQAHSHEMLYSAVHVSSIEMKHTLWAAGTAYAGAELGAGAMAAGWACLLAFVGLGFAATPKEPVRRVSASAAAAFALVPVVVMLHADPAPSWLSAKSHVRQAMAPDLSEGLTLAEMRSPQTWGDRPAPAIELRTDGTRLNGRAVADADLASAVQAQMDSTLAFAEATAGESRFADDYAPDGRLLVHVDGATPFSRVGHLLDVAATAGFDRQEWTVAGDWGRAFFRTTQPEVDRPELSVESPFEEQEDRFAGQPLEAEKIKHPELVVVVHADGLDIVAGGAISSTSPAHKLKCKPKPCADADAWPVVALQAKLGVLKDHYPDYERAGIVPGPDVPWQTVVRVAEALIADPDGRNLFGNLSFGWGPAVRDPDEPVSGERITLDPIGGPNDADSILKLLLERGNVDPKWLQQPDNPDVLDFGDVGGLE